LHVFFSVDLRDVVKIVKYGEEPYTGFVVPTVDVHQSWSCFPLVCVPLMPTPKARNFAVRCFPNGIHETTKPHVCYVCVFEFRALYNSGNFHWRVISFVHFGYHATLVGLVVS
jgi:hypothetical protein